MPDGSGPARGRPPKFNEPRRVVTMTLPEATLDALARLDVDRARAVVRATEIAVGASPQDPARQVETLAVTRDTAVITVPFCQALSELPGLRLIEIAPGRHLVLLEPDLPLAAVELALLDRLDVLPPGDTLNRPVLSQLIDHLRSYRRSRRARTGELILVDI